MTGSKRNADNGYPFPVRGFPPGEYPFLALLPGALESPALSLIETARVPGTILFRDAVVRLVKEDGFCWVDESVPCIVLSHIYYRTGSDLDLYLDLLHEVTHIRQVLEGRDVWDEAFPYHLRPTEIEGYAVAVFECRRLGLDENAVREHLTNPWMTSSQVSELLDGNNAYLGSLG